jgi:peptide/nickel transport system permease protein
MSGVGPKLARRAGFYLLAAWAAITLNFLIPRMMPGDPVGVMVAQAQGSLGPEAIEATKLALGIDENASLWGQYTGYLGEQLSGNLGMSYSRRVPVGDLIIEALAWTLFLAGTAVCISFVLGTLLGAIATWRRGSWLDQGLPPLLSLLSAFPYFWMAMLLLWIFGLQLGWMPSRGAYDPGIDPGWSLEFAWSSMQHALLPGLTLVIASVCGWMLSMRSTMISVLGENYIRFARVRGLQPRRVMLHYAARNALIPNLTGFGMALGYVLGGALLTEMVFGYPGQGFLLLDAVRSQDYPLMQGLFLTITLAVLLANFLVDGLTLLLDPRTRR